MKLFKSTLILIAAASLIACGDSGSDNNGENNGGNNGGGDQQCMASFAQSDACGGTVDGDYTLDSVCSDFDWQSELEQACPTVSVSNVSYSGSGTLTLSSGSYTRDATGTVSLSVSVPTECAATGCSSVEAALQAEIDENYDSGDATCSDAGTGCDCDVTATASDQASGSYTTSGGVLTTDADRTFYYCVEGDTLQAREFDSDAPESGFTQLWTR